MTQQIEQCIVGVDVSINSLDLYISTTDQFCSIANETESVEAWLDRQTGSVCLAIEPTNTITWVLPQRRTCEVTRST